MAQIGIKACSSSSIMYINGKSEEIDQFIRTEIPANAPTFAEPNGVIVYEVSLPLDILLLLFDENYSSAANPFDELED